MHRECRERFPYHRIKMKPLVSDPACITARASRTCRGECRDRLIRNVGENVPGIPGACATRNFTYLIRAIDNRYPKLTTLSLSRSSSRLSIAFGNMGNDMHVLFWDYVSLYLKFSRMKDEKYYSVSYNYTTVLKSAYRIYYLCILLMKFIAPQKAGWGGGFY